MKRRRRPRALLAPWPLRCGACGGPVYCGHCGALQPIRRWTQEEIDDFNAEVEKVIAGGEGSFSEFFEREVE